MSENQTKFITLLREMFQLEQNDLDFGIYRVINLKSKEIQTFLDTTLTQKIQATIDKSANEAKQKRLEELKKDTAVQTYIVSPQEALLVVPVIKEYVELDQELKQSSSSSDIENALYNSLYEFFNRYYENGDFISKRRYTNETQYSLPYNGEEVKLHWATADQYYIKSSENFKDYRFNVGNTTVVFKLTDASTEQNNNKGDRRFIQRGDIIVSDKEVIIPFVYEKSEKAQFPKAKPDGASLNEETLGTVKKVLTDATLLEAIEKHLKKYTAKNSFDYFIHKDLKGFLNNEMDVYIKNNILKDILNSNHVEEQLNKAKVFKTIASDIINFLSQIEEFQKSLWLKKKFIYNANYCLTLDKIPETVKDEIVTALIESAEQKAEWTKLFGVEIKSQNDLTDYLVMDTKFLSPELKYKLLSAFEDLDASTDGLLINSENFGALNLLQERYKEQVQCVYIDPPYNTGTDFIYKDTFQHSSWLSMIQDRIIAMRHLMDNSGRFFCSIDDRESNRLLELLYIHFGKENYLNAITWEKRTKSQNTKTSKYMLQSKIEYIHPFRFEDKRQEFNLEISGQREYPLEDVLGLYRVQKAEQDSLDRPHAAKSMVYDIMGVMPDEGKCWKFGIDTKKYWEENNRIILKDGWPHIIYRPEDEDQDIHKPFWSHFFDKEIYGTAEKGLDFLDKKMGFGKEFQTVKPIELLYKLLFHSTSTNALILDYFAGSATTAHALINLNRNNNSARKYILVEMGEYFESYTKPRVIKAIYTDNWKDGKPQDKNGIAQMVKYFKLESYEDTLNNLNFKSDNGLLEALKDEYIINYMMGYETPRYSLEIFTKPFEYKLNITQKNESVATPIDLVETFNYLIGLKVKTMSMREHYLLIKGTNLKDEAISVVWRKDTSVEFMLEVGDTFEGTVYINGDTTLENALSLEEEFAKRMWGENL